MPVGPQSTHSKPLYNSLMKKELDTEGISEKFLYGSTGACHYIVENIENENLVPWLRNAGCGWWQLLRSLEAILSWHYAACWNLQKLTLLPGIVSSWVSSSSGYVFYFPVERHAFSSFWLMIFNII